MWDKETRKFLSRDQQAVMDKMGLAGDSYLIVKANEMIEQTPVTYEQEDLGDQAVAHLHYFYGGCDWWITEKDVEDGVSQAFGFACLGDPQMAELGYISIEELTDAGVELDLHWTPITLAEVKAKLRSST